MTSINFTLAEAISLYTSMFRDITAFSLITAAVVIYTILVLINIDNKEMNYVFIGLNVIILIFLFANHGMDTINNIDSFFNTNVLKNLYFYYFNTMFMLCLVTSILRNKRIEKSIKSMVIVVYGVSLINLFLVLYMSYVVNNNVIYILGNTFPMFYFGNISNIVIYGILLLYFLVAYKKVRKHRFSPQN